MHIPRVILCALVYSCALSYVTVSSCVLSCIQYASKLASVGHYSSIAYNNVNSLWSRICLRQRFNNPMDSQWTKLAFIVHSLVL